MSTPRFDDDDNVYETFRRGIWRWKRIIIRTINVMTKQSSVLQNYLITRFYWSDSCRPLEPSCKKHSGSLCDLLWLPCCDQRIKEIPINNVCSPFWTMVNRAGWHASISIPLLTLPSTSALKSINSCAHVLPWRQTLLVTSRWWLLKQSK